MTENAPNIIFTRYLYSKDEVQLALLVNILNKSEKSLFWAYELYYSGFEQDVFSLLWKIYFDFYYTLNPSFYTYFIKKHKEWKKTPTLHRIIGIIVGDLLIRPHTLDVFLLNHIANTFSITIDIDIGTNPLQILEWLQHKNYLKIAEFILNRCSTPAELNAAMKIISNYFKERNVKVDIKMLQESKNLHHTDINKNYLALANIMMWFSTLEKLTPGKKFYIIVDDKDIAIFETLKANCDEGQYPYKILPQAYSHSIDEDNYLSLFRLQRETPSFNLTEAYLRHWEYYASFSPIWQKRIQKHKGTINHETKRIEFPDDDHFEEFYDEFNYETDEQRTETQEKSIQDIKQERTWASFYEQHKKGLFVPDAEYLEEFGKISYKS